MFWLSLSTAHCPHLFNLNDDVKKTKKPLNRNLNGDSENSGDAIRICIEDEEKMKTMKEFIDLELLNKKNEVRDFREIAMSFWEAASALHNFNVILPFSDVQLLYKMRDSDDDGLHNKDYDVAALANNMSEAFRHKIYGNEDNEEELQDVFFDDDSNQVVI